MGKMFELMMNKRLSRFLYDNNFISERQSAFRKGRGTMSNLFELHRRIVSSRNAARVVLVASLDLTKAFDTVDRRVLFDILRFQTRLTGEDLAFLHHFWERGYRRQGTSCALGGGYRFRTVCLRGRL
jgi:hypothetical protein